MTQLRYTAQVKAARINEWYDANRVGDLDARLEAELHARFTADRVVIEVERSRFLISVCADRSTAAGINTLVRGKLGKRRTFNRRNRGEARDDVAITIGEPLIGTG